MLKAMTYSTVALLAMTAVSAGAQTKVLPGEMKTVTATVEAIEQSSREVTVRKPDGTDVTFYVPTSMFFFRVDAVRNPDELFAVERPTRPGFHGHVPFSRTEFDAIRRGTDVFTDVSAARPSVPTRINGRAARGMFVSGNFFDMLGVTAVLGRTLTQADNDHGGQAVVVLTQLGWEKFFATDPAVIGRQLHINGQPYEVVGVMPKGFRGLSQEPQDYRAPLARLGQVRPEEKPDEAWVDVVGRLKPAMVTRERRATDNHHPRAHF